MENKLKDYGRSILLGAVAGIGLAVIFAAGFFARDFVNIPLVLGRDDTSYPLLDEVEYLLTQHYLRELPDYTSRQYEAIRGMLRSLGDPNTFFIDPPVAQSEADALAGTYGGIGVQLQRSPTGDFIVIPFEDSPALRAGLTEGDLLVAINGQPVDTSRQQDAIDQMLRGEVKDGNGVEVTVQQRDGDLLTVFIVFDVINVPSVLWRVLPDTSQIGYVQLLRFTNRTPTELRQGLAELRASGVTGIILDLRNNGGGLLQESLEVAGEFLDGGVILYQRSNNHEETFMASAGGAMTDLPLVVLVNRGTASASELVAGALLDRKRGILIGQTTYGKGTIQQIYKLSDASSIHVTSAEWLTPNRFALDGRGLEPTIAMIPSDSGADVELGEAIRYLEQQLEETRAAS